MSHRILVVMGTRPEGIKLAPVVREFIQQRSIEPILVNTGQHTALLEQAIDIFGLRPDFDLSIGQPNMSLTDITSACIRGLEPVLAEIAPDAVLVQGDTTSTLSGALAAFYAGIPLIHLEAGLRTGDPLNPFPEEINRRIVSQIAALHLAPTVSAAQNLLREGRDRSSIVVTGNTVVDALLWTAGTRQGDSQDWFQRAEGKGRRALLVTAHRRESWGVGVRDIGTALRQLSIDIPDISIVIPLHPNPILHNSINPFVQDRENIHVIPPMPYPEFVSILVQSDVVLTDSGGIQEEAPALGKPVLVMRATTERPEGIAAGTAALVGTSPARIVEAVRELLFDDDAYSRMARAHNPYGDGKAAARVTAAVRRLFAPGIGVDEFGDLGGKSQSCCPPAEDARGEAER